MPCGAAGVPFAALLTAAAVGAICLLVFLPDVHGNERLSKAERARWAAGFVVFPLLVVAYWWRHARG